jgi:hypothetical protein
MSRADQLAVIARFNRNLEELTEASEAASLIASEPVRAVADDLADRARVMAVPDEISAEELNRRNSELADLERAFRAVAREELHGSTSPKRP